MKRVHIYYSGRVQGVGFRFTAEDLARELGLFGWVRNLKDARVELVAEGEEDKLKELLKRIKGYFSGYIQDVNLSWDEASGEFNDFGIRF